MNFRICRCCGQRMSDGATAVSLNPNVCVACFDLPNEAGLPNESGGLALSLVSRRHGLEQRTLVQSPRRASVEEFVCRFYPCPTIDSAPSSNWILAR